MNIQFPVAQAPVTKKDPILVNLGDYDPDYQDWYVAITPVIPASVAFAFEKMTHDNVDQADKFTLLHDIFKETLLGWNFSQTDYTTGVTSALPQPSEHDWSAIDRIPLVVQTLLIKAISSVIAPPKNSDAPSTTP